MLCSQKCFYASDLQRIVHSHILWSVLWSTSATYTSLQEMRWPIKSGNGLPNFTLLEHFTSQWWIHISGNTIILNYDLYNNNWSVGVALQTIIGVDSWIPTDWWIGMDTHICLQTVIYIKGHGSLTSLCSTTSKLCTEVSSLLFYSASVVFAYANCLGKASRLPLIFLLVSTGMPP